MCRQFAWHPDCPVHTGRSTMQPLATPRIADELSYAATVKADEQGNGSTTKDRMG
jgi:hypothetical protein